MKKIRLGELLLDAGLVKEEVLQEAYERQKKTGEKLGRALINMGAVEETPLLKLLAQQLKVDYIPLESFKINNDKALLLPETYARRFRALVLDEKDGTLLLGLADPLDIYAYDELRNILKRPVTRVVVSESLLLNIIDKVYRHTREISHFAEELSGEIEEQDDLGSLFFAGMDAEDAPVVKLVLSLFKDAATAGASDIHIEPGEKVLRIRLRIDGMLQENVIDDKRIARPLVQRLKMRANMDISEKRIPQDGRFSMSVKGKNFDVRVSTLPVADGESVVMRLLDQSSPVMELEDLGMPANVSHRIEKIYKQPHGMLLVTGPTGSGKTTTLYSILAKLNQAEKKIITVEDPVEYRLPRINQVQVNSKIDLTFARVLRAILRQDPDTIMVGEIRDMETAQIAMRAAMTGHFVLATLHTNDAMSSALRLIDMGVEGYMVASSLKGILAQRLVRLLCQECAVSYEPSHEEIDWLEGGIDSQAATFKKEIGCNHCHFSGFRGRQGIYELLETNHRLADSLRANDSQAFAQAVRESKEFVSLKDAIVDLALSGKTSIFEAIRVVGEINEEALA